MSNDYPNFTDVTNVELQTMNQVDEDAKMYVYVITNPEEYMLIDSVFTTYAQAHVRLDYITNEIHKSGKIVRMELNRPY